MLLPAVLARFASAFSIRVASGRSWMLSVYRAPLLKGCVLLSPVYGSSRGGWLFLVRFCRRGWGIKAVGRLSVYVLEKSFFPLWGEKDGHFFSLFMLVDFFLGKAVFFN